MNNTALPPPDVDPEFHEEAMNYTVLAHPPAAVPEFHEISEENAKENQEGFEQEKEQLKRPKKKKIRKVMKTSAHAASLGSKSSHHKKGVKKLVKRFRCPNCNEISRVEIDKGEQFMKCGNCGTERRI
jgi:hypothetical protein